MRYAGIILNDADAQIFSNQIDSCRQGIHLSGPCQLEIGGNLIKNVDQAFFFGSLSEEVKLLAACNFFQDIGSLISAGQFVKPKKKLYISFQENHIDARQLAEPAWSKSIAPYFSANYFYKAAPKRYGIKRCGWWRGPSRRKNSILPNYPENLADSILSVPCQTYFATYQLMSVPANAMSTTTGLYQGKTRQDMKSGAFGPYDYRYPSVFPVSQKQKAPGFEILGPAAMTYTLTFPGDLRSFAMSGQIPDTFMPDSVHEIPAIFQADVKTYGQNVRFPNGQFISDQDTFTQSYLHLLPTNGYRLVCHFPLSKKNLEWTFANWSGLPWERIRAQNDEPCECVAHATFKTPAYPVELELQGNMECDISLGEQATNEFQSHVAELWIKRLSLKTNQPEFELRLKFKPEPAGNYLGFRWLIK
jgi:hypothetical protein